MLSIPLHKRQGVSIIGAVLSLVILSLFGAGMLALVSTDQAARSHLVNKVRAASASQTGMEYALREIYTGGNPVVINKPVGLGTFTVETDPSLNQVRVTGAAGTARSLSQATTTFADDCVVVDDNQQATATGPDRTEVHGITFHKDCLEGTTIDKFYLTWSPNDGERLLTVEIEGQVYYNDGTGTASGEVTDLVDFYFTGNSVYHVHELRFTGAMDATTMEFGVIFTDGSQTSGTVSILPF